MFSLNLLFLRRIISILALSAGIDNENKSDN
jgi:hypothetical protein